MQFVVIVQVHKPMEKLLDDDSNLCLSKRARLHEIGTAPSGTEFHDNPEIGAVKVRAIVLGDILRVHSRQDRNLGDYIVYLVFGILDIDDFDGHYIAGPTINPELC
jgi:hypothetical protein